MRLLVCGLVVLSALADEKAPAPLTKGTFVEWSGSDAAGTFVFRDEGQSYRCVFSGKTYIERDQKRTRISAIPVGHDLEVLSEKLSDSPPCRALIVRLVDPKVTLRSRLKPYSVGPEPLLPRGSLSFAGIVTFADDLGIFLKARDGQEKRVMFRRDTRFGGDGMEADRKALPLNKPVFIRAGRNAENEIEAYSIYWGNMLRPE